MSEQQCRRCGDPLPPRSDPRGRPARYCSGACRAAASRARRAAEVAAQPPSSEAVIRAVEELAETAEHRALTFVEVAYARRVTDAAARLSEAHRARLADPPRSAATPNRQQRRAARRKHQS